MPAPLERILDSGDGSIYDIRAHAPGPQGSLPLTPEMLRERPSGDLFAWSQDVGMGWKPEDLGGKEILLLSTHGGIRDAQGKPIALGYHTGHWEVGLLMQAAAEELKGLGAVPFAGYCTDPCDGRTQGTSGMFDSLPYRNDAAIIFRRLIRSLPTRRGVIGFATCDKGLPAMMMALAGSGDMPSVLVPGGVTLVPEKGEDTAKVQTIGARFAHGAITLEEAAEAGCRTCASPGGGCHFLGTAATSQVVGEALGMSLPHSALAPSGHPIWLDMARRSARAVLELERRGLAMRRLLTDASIRNAMVTHAAFGGSTNLIIHVPAIAHAAGLHRPTVDDWAAVNRQVPRLVDALPNGPRNFPTVMVFLAGGVPEVMLHLRRLGLLSLDELTASGATLGQTLDWWEGSERRARLRRLLKEREGVDPDDVIMDPTTAARRGLTSTVTFPKGNLAPEGAVIKSTSIDPSVVDADGVYRKRGPARVFTSEPAAMEAIKNGTVRAGDILVLAGRGPAGAGMEEIYQMTSALKHLDFGKHVAVITDARFSGVSTGACIGHVSPEALAGGPLGKVVDGDLIEIVIDRIRLEGSVNLVGVDNPEQVLRDRPTHPALAPDPALPADTRLWAALQNVSGGTWGGCVYDTEEILKVLEAGQRALERKMAQARFAEAVRLEDEGQPDRALAVWRELAISHPTRNAFLRLASCAKDLRLTDEAEIAFTSALKIDGRSSPALAGLGLLAIDRRDFAAAEGYLQRACAVEDLALSFTLLGFVLTRRAKPLEAEEAYRQAIRFDANYEEAYYNLGVLLRKDRPSEAQALFRKALELDPNYAVAHRELGWALIKPGTRDEETEGHLRKAIELEPRDAWAHIYLGTYLWDNDVESAVAEFQVARDLEPKWIPPLSSLGNIHAFVLEDFDAAQSFFEQALGLSPDDTVTLTAFGRLCKKRGQLDLAKHYLNRALLLDPQDEKALALLADIAPERRK
jgi:putative YjhG/YagF family dehydratase